MSERRNANYIKQCGTKGIVMAIMLVLYMLKIIYMSYKNGIGGIAFYANADILYLLVFMFMGMAVVPVMKKMLYFQINHGSYKNAEKVYKVVTGAIMAGTIVLAASIFIFSDKISMLMSNNILSGLLIKLVAVAIVIRCLMDCLKGYMEGVGNPLPGLVGDVLSYAIGLVVTIVFQPAFAEHGRKIAAVMRQDNYIYAYSACCGILGLIIGNLIAFSFLLVIKLVFGRELKMRTKKDEARKTDLIQDIIWNFLRNYWQQIPGEYIGVILGAVLFILSNRMAEPLSGGIVYSVFAVIILPGTFIASQIAMPLAKQLVAIMRQGDFYHAKERMGLQLKLVSYTLLPYVLFVFAMAPLLTECLFDVTVSEFVTVVRNAAWILLVLVYGVFIRKTALQFIKTYMRYLCDLLWILSGIGFWLILSKSISTPVMAMIYSYMLAGLLQMLVLGFLSLKKIRIYNKLLGSVFMPLLCAAVSVAIAYALYMIFNSGVWGLLMVEVVLVYLLHNLMIVLLRIFEPHEWPEVPYCNLWVAFAKMIGRY